MKAAVVGAGLGGLTIACLLARDGIQVTVYEKNDTVGGKINQVKTDGFRFDTGPSLLTMPHLLELVFQKCNADIHDYLKITPLDPLCRYFYPDGTVFDNYQETKRTLQEIERIAPEDVAAYTDFLNYTEQLYDRTKDSFLFNPLYHLSDLKGIDLGNFFRIDAFKTVSRRIDEWFESPYLRQFFKRFATYNGSSPYQAPATLNVIPHVEITLGGYYVDGGIYEIARSLRELAESLNVSFQMNTRVSTILTQNGEVTGIRTSGDEEFKADFVISNSDSYETYMNLLPKREVSFLKRKIIQKSEPSCSGFVLLLGIDRRYGQLRHHNVFFSEDYREEFKAIFKDKVPPADPTIYIANTSASNPDHAIPGGSNLFILVNAPYLTDRFEWKDIQEDYADRVVEKLEHTGLDGLSKSVHYRQTITPKDFYEKYRSNRGSIYGSSSNSRLAAFLRPRNKAGGINGLYLAGGSTHPGGGIPLVLLSAMHAFELIKRYEY